MALCSRAVSAFVLTVSLALSGKVLAETPQPAPAEARPTSIVYSNKGPSGWTDLAIGAYRVPDSDVVVSGHQQASALPLFGVAGVAAASAINNGVGKNAVANAQDALKISVVGIAAQATQDALQSGRYGQRFTLGGAPADSVLTVTPFVVVTFVSDTEVRPFVVLKTELKSQPSDAAPRPVKYFCCAGQAIPLPRDGGQADAAAALKGVIAKEVETAVKVMLDDVATPYARDEGKLIYVSGNFPFVRKKLKLRGYELMEDDNMLVFAVRGSAVYSGVEVAEKSAISFELAPSRK